jgi:hypothetical protein
LGLARRARGGRSARSRDRYAARRVERQSPNHGGAGRECVALEAGRVFSWATVQEIDHMAASPARAREPIHVRLNLDPQARAELERIAEQDRLAGWVLSCHRRLAW